MGGEGGLVDGMMDGWMYVDECVYLCMLICLFACFCVYLFVCMLVCIWPDHEIERKFINFAQIGGNKQSASLTQRGCY